jgi:hypothetical protein
LPSRTSDAKINAAREAHMPQRAATMQETLRMLRIVHAALLVFIALQPWVVEIVFASPAGSPDRTFVAAVAFVALLCASIAIVVRIRTLRPAYRALRMNPDDALSAKKWRAGSIISYALALSVPMFGARLRTMGASIAQVVPFYVGGFVLMLVWWPRRP